MPEARRHHPGARPLAAIVPSKIGIGMVSPATPFVDPNLTLAPVSFAFLFTLWKSASEQDARITAIEARLTAAGIP